MQLALGAKLPFEKDRDPAPAAGAKVGEPQPAVDAFDGLATIMIPGVVGRESLKFRLLKYVEVGFVSVKVRVETPPTVVGSGLKLLEMVMAEGSRI